ncbi:MAG: hypothetical protein QXV69_03190 [Sulfolobaceae archaeon]
MPESFNPEIIAKIVREDLLRYTNGKYIPSVRVIVYPFEPSILAYVRANEPTIYINSIPLSSTKMNKAEYLYVVILHEYLHIIGIADEREVRRMTLNIVSDKFGENSEPYKLALSLADPRDIYLINSWKKGRPMSYI